MIIHALKKWWSDLLGTKFYVYTDHRTLENFDSQKDLSRRQLHWQEFLSQYDMTIMYICGEDNTVADALSHLPPNTFLDESEISPAINAVLSVATDESILNSIRSGYMDDEFCKQVASSGINGWRKSNDLWYVGDQLLIPRVGNV